MYHLWNVGNPSLACKNHHSPKGWQLERLSQVPWFFSPCTIVLFTLLFSAEIPLVYPMSRILFTLLWCVLKQQLLLRPRQEETRTSFNLPSMNLPRVYPPGRGCVSHAKAMHTLMSRVPSPENRRVATFPSLDEKGSYNGPCTPIETGNKSIWETIPSYLHASPFQRKKIKDAYKN